MTYPNPEQRQVLGHLHGTLLVLAPAGTGKTRLMADRLATGMSPEVTLGVTFTNRAALARNLDFLATDDASIPTVHPSKGFEFVTVIIAQLCVSLCALRNSAFRFIPSSNPHRPGSASPCDLFPLLFNPSH